VNICRTALSSPLARGRRAALWLSLALGAILMLVLADRLAVQVGDDNLRSAGGHRLDIYAAGLESELAKYEYLPRLLALEQDVLALLRNPTDPAAVQRANDRLQRLNQIAGTSVLYVLNSHGVALASSDWSEKANVVGMNLSYRPYFRDAMEHGEGRFYAIGTTSGIPGFYFSHLLRDQDRVLGVAAVKVDIARLERTWAGSRDVVLATDANGVIFLASEASWKFSAVHPLSEEASRRIRESLQYGTAAPKPLRSSVQRRFPDGAKVVTVGLPGTDWRSEQDYLKLERPLSEAGWHLLLLSDRTPVHEFRRLAWALALALSAFLSVLLLYARQRRLFFAQTIAANAALERANDALEHKVSERTADLLASNAQLQREITERERAEQNLVQAGKLAVLGQMAAGITHELNQPLSALRTLSANAGIFLARGRLEGVQQNLQLIEELTERMGRITGQLRAFSRKDPLQREPVKLDRSIANALFLLDQRLREQKVVLTRELPAPDVCVLADATRLEQVLVNLIGNAIDATSAKAQPLILIAVSQAEGHVEVAVRDNGDGITPENLSRLFEPFFTTKPSGKGLGLGLVISIGIAHDLGGDLTAGNRPEGGAEFVLALQACPAEQTHE
jgi:two-component system C4-dicarboxylate transport sensor histidine kinase DctB